MTDIVLENFELKNHTFFYKLYRLFKIDLYSLDYLLQEICSLEQTEEIDMAVRLLYKIINLFEANFDINDGFNIHEKEEKTYFTQALIKDFIRKNMILHKNLNYQELKKQLNTDFNYDGLEQRGYADKFNL